VAEAMVEAMLTELVADQEVQRALQHAPAAPVPWFAQLRTAPTPWAWTEPDEPPLYAEPAEGVPISAAVAHALEQQRTRPPRAERERLRRLQETAEFQELCEEVLEGTLFNLIAESSYGEVDLTQPPRQIVTNLEVLEVPPPPGAADGSSDGARDDGEFGSLLRPQSAGISELDGFLDEADGGSVPAADAGGALVPAPGGVGDATGAAPDSD